MSLTYFLITPARNEATFIEQTLQSVVSQTRRPLRWVIVSDGSTDGTDDIVRRYTAQHDWIELLRMPERTSRDFAGKVGAFHAGYQRVRHLPHDAVCSLDADITFDPEYFEFLIGKLASDPKLGLVGTPHVEDNRTYDFRFASVEHVSGACQLFRRECFEAIGGYRPMPHGGVDLVAVLTSRLRGWKTRTFLEKTCHHHRQMGSATKSGLAVLRHDGYKDYTLGAHPLWELFRCLNRMLKKPFIIGGLSLAYGYFASWITRRPKSAPAEVVAFRRKEQMDRLKSILRRLLRGGRGAAATAGS
jgi:biofilm PGA synthesis N-glycosyltransferase PgaC